MVFDWAGTLVDFGSRAPVIAFLEAFDAAGLPITEAVARGPMGAHKRDHVREILQRPDVADRLPPALAALDPAERVERLYAAFTDRLLEVLPSHARPIDGVPQALAALRARGIAVASGSGYTRAMMDRLEPAARAAGLDPGPVICADELPQGRPAPWALFRLAERFGVYPMAEVLKVGDTPADIAEARQAGARCVALTACGNEVGLAPSDWQALAPAQQARHRARARERLAGAEAWLDSVAELPGWIDAHGA
ncbi:phosphonoacetaldehyde hydrolase [Piscinibacter sakaiensis]|uniref:Phosphonoacetaldehyde hydrolase n=1 Tax=Piscinibacter sakaiensis TaxID=1547922 RepID=A0A0K8P0V0_PISS1|nr:phosphonoacetaldehyde hydrolase [Piscinibacter sakaiensis]